MAPQYMYPLPNDYPPQQIFSDDQHEGVRVDSPLESRRPAPRVDETTGEEGMFGAVSAFYTLD